MSNPCDTLRAWASSTARDERLPKFIDITVETTQDSVRVIKEGLHVDRKLLLADRVEVIRAQTVMTDNKVLTVIFCSSGLVWGRGSP
jgi:hypothetical protein